MNLRTGLVIFLVLALATAAVYYYGFVAPEPEAAKVQAPEDKDAPEVLIKGLSMSSWTDGEKVWEMEVERMELPRFGRNTVLYDITDGTIFRDKGPYLGFSAGMAKVDGRNRMEFSGGVVVDSEGKTLMAAESMSWDPATQKVTVPGEAKITADGSTVLAKNLIVDLNDEYIYTTGEIIAQQGDNIRITAGNMKYSVTRREMEIIGPSKIVIDL
ncbi:MAG TPA: LPS export ABC transporter periplasmic protein LptC [Bacillota bacterium]|nr:LPS export ABC transporter periplasmic protein LptC [Bacillota bacterium]HOH10201.1 LPS export ABC transporter periplasmic protein LptC [Bacillota bacterium]HOS50890.1 LPS export ABC transporter periplasmic protein LptC [Bacillota bacterium]HOY89236.1 LPS export ABC transporter periplasmic protein LptC [Bacillota bacterium]HPI01163.1 LPS export ABC transporter periplasmic protein LptC [Bacillota bacterium]